MSKPLEKDTYVDQAEQVIKSLDTKKQKFERNDGKLDFKLTTNKIRNILTMVTELYNMADKREKELNEDIRSHVQYIRMKVVYEAGREPAVRDFCDKSGLLEHLKSVGNSTDKLLLVCKYMEALVAYHKFYSAEK